MARKEMVSPPKEGEEAPEFNLPGAQGGQLRLRLRTAHGPVIVVFYRGAWCQECVEYFKALAGKEREINVAGATVVGVGPAEPEEARNFVRETGFKSYVLYDYIRVTTKDYGLLQKDAEHGDAARPAVFLIGSDHRVLQAWLDERPAPEDLLAEVSKVTGLPKEPDEEEEGEEKPKKRPKKSAESAGEEAAPAEGGEKAPTSSEGEAEESQKPRQAHNAEAGSGADRDDSQASTTKPEQSSSGEGSQGEAPSGDEER